MPKEWKISPTQVSKYRRCKRLYAFEYVEGLWPDSTDKQTFGSDVHKQLERWIQEVVPPDTSQEGMTAKQAIGWIPAPNSALKVEQSFSFALFDGVNAAGFIDLVIPPGTIEALSIPMVIDYKTTSDLRWAMSQGQLAADPQALIYSCWAMFKYHAPRVTARWIYLAATNPQPKRMPDGSWVQPPRKPRGCKPIEFTFSASDIHFVSQWEQLIEDVRQMLTIRMRELPGLSLDPSPESCSMYGGCPHKHRCNLSPGDILAGYMNRGLVIV